MKGNEKRLARHYKKAARKLRALEWKANPEAQKKYANIQNKVAKVGLGVGLAGIGAAAGAHGIVHALQKKRSGIANDMLSTYAPSLGSNNAYEIYSAYQAAMSQAPKLDDVDRKLRKYRKNASKVTDIVTKVSGPALGIAAGSKIMAANAKWRTTPKGHAKMVANRDAWKKEMKDAFKGTKYQNLPSYMKTKKRN